MNKEEEIQAESEYFKAPLESEFECPECGDVGSECIEISISPYSGRYCLKCYAKWVSENFPKLTRK